MSETPSSDSASSVAVAAWEALFRAQATLVRRFAAQDVWGPVSLREYDVLYTLSRCLSRRARLGALTEAVLLPQPSLSRLVDRLEAKGLLAREPDPGDARGTVVVLTDAGAQVQREVGRRHAASIAAELGAALDADQLRQLRDLCTAVVAGPRSPGSTG